MAISSTQHLLMLKDCRMLIGFASNRPSMTIPWRRGCVVIFILYWLIFLPPLHADYVYMIDGFTLYGKVEKEGRYIDDPSGFDIWVPNAGYLVDDQARRVFFSYKIVAEAHKDPENHKSDQETFTLKQPFNPFKPLIPNVVFERAEPWQKNGERKLQLRTPLPLTVEQFVVKVTPLSVRTQARLHRWYTGMLPSEFQPQELLDILRTHPDALGKEPDSASSRIRLLRFCLQTGWYAEAEAERIALLKQHPEMEKEIEGITQELRRLQALKADQDIQRAIRTGQFQRLHQLLQAASEEGASDAVRTRLRNARIMWQDLQAQLEAARVHLAQVKKRATDQGLLARWAEILREMEEHLNLETCPRLEVFTTLAQQEERRASRKQPPEYKAEQLLALAISGWIMGPRGAETSSGYATRLCQGREMVLRYLQIEDRAQREKYLYEYQQMEPLRVDEMAQLLEFIPPPLAEKEPSLELVKEHVTPVSKEWPKGVPYQVQRPPEYHAHRPYPVLIVLPDPGLSEYGDALQCTPQHIKQLWGPAASEHGFLLVIPEWLAPGQKTYRGTAREQAAVFEVLRDVRRRYFVDGERICLAGFYQAGTLVYDLGLSHPDRFAAVSVICGKPSKMAKMLRSNGQYLPFYIVDGEKNFESPKENKAVFDYWVQRGFPSLFVEYYGRGFERYEQEIPLIVDWMSRKQRSRGLPDLGREDITRTNLGDEIKSTRTTDQRFYWITSSDLTGSLNRPAMLTAKQVRGNEFVIKAAGFKQLSIWLHSSMVDFEIPVEIRLNPGSPYGQTFKKIVVPSLPVMLEDYFERGDRKNLYMGRVDFDLGRR